MKTKNFLGKVKTAGVSLSAMATTALLASPLAFAVEPAEIVSELVNYVWDIFRWIGILLLVWSIGMLALAFKNEDADSKSRSMMLLVVSIMLIGLSGIFGDYITGLIDG